MPYGVFEKGPKDKPFCVYKKDPDGNPIGASLGCHPSTEKANEQMAAIYANEGNAAKCDDCEAEDYAIKAVGDWELDVRGIPFGATDSDGQWFDEHTETMPDHFKAPVPTYYHGLKEEVPEVIGKTVSITKKADGWWAHIILDKTKEYAGKIWEAAKAGGAYASSGTIRHMARLERNGSVYPWSKKTPGRISVWPWAEIAIFDVENKQTPASWRAVALPAIKSVYQQAGISWPVTESPEGDEAEGEDITQSAASKKGTEIIDGKTQTRRNEEMEEKELQTLIAAEVAKGLESAMAISRKAAEEEAKRKAEEEAAIKAASDKAVADAKAEWEREAAKHNRLPGGGAPTVAKYGDVKYSYVSGADMAFAIDALKAAGKPISEGAYKACAVKLCDEVKNSEYAAHAAGAMKAAGFAFDGEAIKANEVNYSTLSSYGDEWVVTANSNALWEVIRAETQVVSMLPSVEVPQGSESIKIPLESTDPTFYKVAQVTSDAATTGLSTPAPTVTSSRLGTSNTTLTLGKLGARVRWSGEMDEDSIVPFAPQLRKQLATVGAEYLDHIVLDGDTRTTASTNINDIAGTPAGTEAYLLAAGMRYIALATSGRSRSGGAVDENDFVETMKLLGTAGIAAADPTKVAFIVDPWTHFKMLTEITALKTADVYPGSPTISSGKITQLWGRRVIVSHQLGYVYKYSPHTMTGYENKFQTDGKIDQDTASDNTTGTILLPRFDRWLFGWKRRMTTEVTRHPEWDGSEIVALTRFGLVYRDSTNAAAITYNVTIA